MLCRKVRCRFLLTVGWRPLLDKQSKCRNQSRKCFLSLIDHHFPKSNPLHKIFNRNTLWLSYSCMTSVKSIISRQNKAQIGTPLNPPEEIKDNCNCRIKSFCLLEGNCKVRNIVYQASVVPVYSLLISWLR